MSTNTNDSNDSFKNKLFSTRNKLWTPELDRLLRNWKRQIGKRENGHNNLARKYNRRHYIFGLPAILLAAILSSGVLTTFQNCSDCDDNTNIVECQIVQYFRLLFGLLGILNTALVGFQTFMNYQEEAEKHKSAADDYGSLFRLLDSMILMPGPIRGDPITSLQNIRSRYDDLVRRSPSLPKKYNVDLSYNVSNPGTIPPPPPLSSGGGNISDRAYNDLKRVYEHSDKNLNKNLDFSKLNDEISNSNKSTPKTKKSFFNRKKQNEHDDDKEVTLEKELEEYPSNYMDNTCSNISPELNNQYMLKNVLNNSFIDYPGTQYISSDKDASSELSFTTDKNSLSTSGGEVVDEEEVKDEEPDEEM